MRTLTSALAVLLALSVPALAQQSRSDASSPSSDAPSSQPGSPSSQSGATSGATSGTGSSSTMTDAAGSMANRQQLQSALRAAGFTNVQSLETAYFVQATTPQGESVMMVVNPPAGASGATLGGAAMPGSVLGGSSSTSPAQSGSPMPGGSVPGTAQ